MTTDVDQTVDALIKAWETSREPLDEWVRTVSSAFQDCGIKLPDAAESVGATQAEFEAVLRLDALNDGVLGIVSGANPPTTTWMLLAQVPTEGIETALAHLRDRDRGTAFESVRAVLLTLTGSSPAERVAVVGADVFEHAAKKARAYSVWPKDIHPKALTGFARWRRSGKPLTPKQAGYALGLLTELVEAGAIQLPSPDDDDEFCQAVLGAIY